MCLSFLVSLAWGLLILIFLKNSWVHWFFSIFLFSILLILQDSVLFPNFCWLSAYFALILGSWDESLDCWFEPSFWLYAFNALNSFLNTTLAISYKFGYVVVIFTQFSVLFKLPLRLLWLPNYLEVCGLVSRCMKVVIFLLHRLSLDSLWMENT